MIQPALNRRVFLAASLAVAFAARAGVLAPPARLSLNENAFGPSPRVARAMAAELPHLARYADQADADRLAARIAVIEGVAPDQILLGDLLESLGRYLAGQAPVGGRFVLSTPGYPALVDAARPLGGQGVGVPLAADLRDDLPALATAAQGAKALFLVQPHNPSGTVHPPERFASFLRAVSARTLVIVDEAYLDYHEIATSAVAQTRAGANVAVFRTFDKIHGLAALPLGYAIVPRDLGAALRAQGIGAAHSLSRIALVAAEASLDDPAWRAQVRRRTIAGRDRLHGALDALGLEHSASVANFVFFRSPVPDLRARLEQAGIQTGRPFAPFDQWLRITVGTEAEVTRTIAALHSALRHGSPS